jgi:predicted CxxxxCH...CXXCH cytochrome family protein
VHLNLNSTGSPVSCNTCHNGLGSGTLNHYDRAKSRVLPGDVVFNSSYLAESGTRSFDNVSTSGTYLTCNAVSCHGGQRTPNWQAGTLDVTNQCTSCHAQGTAQYNSYDSGAHGDHVGIFGNNSDTCKLCHNAATLEVNHFTALNTTAMEGPASATVGGGTTIVVTYNAGSCTPTSGTGCHGTRNW